LRVYNPVATSISATSTNKEIVDNNKFMINRSNIILAEMYPHDSPSLGTISEIVYAGVRGLPVIAFGGSGLLEYPWIDVHVTVKLETLEEAIAYIIANYS
jgi:nucleoside 2-deoxyribosyltransferase